MTGKDNAMARIVMYTAIMVAVLTIAALPSAEDPYKTLIPPFCGIVLVVGLVGFALWVEFFYEPKPKPRRRVKRVAVSTPESGESLVPPVESQAAEPRVELPNRPLTPAEIRKYLGDDEEIRVAGQKIGTTGTIGGKNVIS